MADDRIDIIITDHISDTILQKLEKMNLLVNQADEAFNKFNKTKPNNQAPIYDENTKSIQKLESMRQKEIASLARELTSTSTLETALERLTQAQERYGNAKSQGYITDQQYSILMNKAQSEYDRTAMRIENYNKVMGVTGDKTRLARHEMLNLSYQLQDVVVGFASGQRPMTIFIQQGSQIAQVAAASGMGIKGITSAIKDMTVSGLSMVGRLALNPYFLGITSVVGLATFAYKDFQDELSDNSGLADAQYQIALTGGNVDDFNAKLKELGGETVTTKDIFNGFFKTLDDYFRTTEIFDSWKNSISSGFHDVVREMNYGTAWWVATVSAIKKTGDDLADPNKNLWSVLDPTQAYTQNFNQAMNDYYSFWNDVSENSKKPLEVRMDTASLKASGKDFDSVEKKYKSTMDSISKSIKDFDREHEQNINNINARWSNLGLGAAETNKDRLADIAKENQRYEEQITQYKEQQANKRNRLDKQEISLANQRASAMQRLLEIESKTGFGVGITSVQKEYSKMKTDVEQDLRKGLISKTDADKAFGQLSVWLNTELPRATVKSIVAFNQLKDPLYSFNENIDWQTESFGLLGDEYDNFNEYQQVYNELLSQGIDLDVSKNKQLDEKIKKTIKATAEDSKLAAAMRAIYDASPTVQLEDNARRQNSLNKLIAKGGSDVDYYRNELEKLKLSETGIIAIQQGWGDTFNSIIKPSEDLNQKLKDLNNTLINRPDLSAYVELQKILSKNQETQITFTTAGASDIYGETQGKLDSLSVSQKQWDNARKAGLVTENEYLMATRKNVVAMDELRQSQGKSAFGEDMIFGLKNLASEWQGIHSEMAGISDQFFSSFSSGFSNAIAGAIIDGDSLKENMHQLSKTILTQVVSSLVQATIQATIFKAALSMGIGSFFGAGSLGAIGASSSISGGVTGGSNVFGITSAFGLAKGGYVTGSGTTTSDSIPTMLSNKEFVVNADATAKNRTLLEAINRGANVSPMASNKGTAVTMQSNPVNVTVNNNGSGVNATVDASDPQNIEIMIADAIRKQTPKLVAGQLSNPNSEISTSLSRNTNASRRR